ncbi:unnamed protein product [Heligmosomoides polygyrus]|uniref:Uncharacterized protein n=1 Tax=Heligmosomoides polygyrus TaxID=6339 RepID=A0A183GQB0_HELPZ|nr:unnamed protein product [Heligmosomoides polygyrus]
MAGRRRHPQDSAAGLMPGDTRRAAARKTPVAAACQSLWAAKGHLEELHALGISDPSSASTSFESNTDNSPAAGSGESKAREGGADKKRLQYNSHFDFSIALMCSWSVLDIQL